MCGIAGTLLKHPAVLRGLPRYKDRSSMAWSIETLPSFLDFNLIEYCLSLPVELKIHNGWSKYLLRKSASGKSPDSVVWRRSKFGFESPESDWLRPYLSSMRRAIQRCLILNEIGDPVCLGEVYDHLDPRSRWRLYVVSRWAKLFEVNGVAG
jgi:asparagine synthase (glutamine-hydrolysing)